nr:MAG TPA: PetN [Caudoviricetes sp.]
MRQFVSYRRIRTFLWGRSGFAYNSCAVAASLSQTTPPA